MSSTDRYNTGAPDILSYVKSLEDRITALESVPRISNATVENGTLQVRDNAGVIQVQLGLLPDGSYGLSVKEPNPANIFHPVPYVYTNAITAGESTSSTTYTDLTTVGPQVTVPVGSSGRILILATAQIQVFTGASVSNTVDGRFDLAFSGANTRNPDETVDPLVGISNITVNMGSGIQDTVGEAISTTTQAVFESLTPGLTTVTMKFRKGAGSTADPTFFRRVLTVFKL